MTGRRLDQRGRVARDEPLVFHWQGRRLKGFKGDTLASALIAQGVRLVGRSPVHRRPRGIMAAGPDDAGPPVALREGGGRRRVGAAGTELEAGMRVEPCAGWPSLALDLGEAADLLAPLRPAAARCASALGALAGPGARARAGRWLARAAGRGRGAPPPDLEETERVHGHCDVLVIGAGPAGLAAAMEAAEVGLDVVLAERDFELGGDLLTEGKVGDRSAEWWRVEALGALRGARAARLMPRTAVFALSGDGVAVMSERLAGAAPDAPRERLHVLRCRRIIVATGAVERAFAFGGNDRPGVMGADAARAYVERFGVAPGRRVVVAATNDSGYRVAGALADAGLEAVLLDSREGPPPHRVRAAQERGVEVIAGAVPVQARGRTGVRALLAGRHRGGGRATPYAELPCDLVAVAGGWSPTLHLSRQAGALPQWDAAQACFLPGEDGRGVRSAGAAAGVWLREEAIASGRAAGRAAAIELGATGRRRLRAPPPGGWDAPIDPVWEVSARGRRLRGFVDLQSDLAAEDIRRAVEGPPGAPPAAPVGDAVGLALAGPERPPAPAGAGAAAFAPRAAAPTPDLLAAAASTAAPAPRRTPFAGRAAAAGAVFAAAGGWDLPLRYPRPGEGGVAALRREAAALRAAAGFADISSDARLLVQGPDAAAFLDRVCATRLGDLAVGRLRASAMLRPDGALLAEVSVRRLAEAEFMVCTPAARAEAAAAHLELWAQARWPELRVAITPVSEGWASLALIGPAAGAALARAGAALAAGGAELTVREARLAGRPARVARLAPCGAPGREVSAYEIDVRPDDAEALWDALAAAVAAEGGAPCGSAALDVLRTEAGRVPARESDARVTLADLGLEALADDDKPFLGAALMRRPAPAAAERPLDPLQRVLAGAALPVPGRRGAREIGPVAAAADPAPSGGPVAPGVAAGGLAAQGARALLARGFGARRPVRLQAASPGEAGPETRPGSGPESDAEGGPRHG